MKLQHLLVASLGLLALISCEKSEAPQAVLPADNVIRVATAGVDAIATRAGATSDNIAEFGMFVTNNNPESSAYRFANAKATRAGSIGSYTWSTDPVMTWKNKTDKVRIVAYAPYDARYSALSGNTATVKTNQSTDANVIASDFLYAISDVTPNNSVTANAIHYADQKLNVKLGHIFSKLEITIKLGTAFNPSGLTNSKNPLSAVLVKNTNTSATIDLGTANITAHRIVSDITPFPTSYAGQDNSSSKNAVAVYEAIIIPQTVLQDTPLTISFMIDGKTYEWASEADGVTFVTGNKYTLELRVGVTVVATSGISASIWGAGTEAESPVEIVTE